VEKTAEAVSVGIHSPVQEAFAISPLLQQHCYSSTATALLPA
jgi:hypothetical protein